MIFNMNGPASGGGGGIELATVTCLHTTNYYTDENMVAQSTTSPMFDVRCPVGTIIFAYGQQEPDPGMTNVGITLMEKYSRYCYVYKVTG